MASSAFRHGVAARYIPSFPKEGDAEELSGARFQGKQEIDNDIPETRDSSAGQSCRLADDIAGSDKDEVGWDCWRGNMTRSIRTHDGNMSKYSDDCLSVHGLYYAFYSGNGKLRTVAYLVVWFAAGAFFLYLTIPLIEDYRNRSVTTSIDTESGVREGLSLPIITVCPRGRGIRCDCQLWRKLHCRYLNVTTNEDWRLRFSHYGCFSYFDVDSNPTDPTWMDPMCEDFEGDEMPSDTCGPTPNEVEEIPSLAAFRGDEMYARILSRESTPDGPYITQEELALYAPSRLGDRVYFVKEGRRVGPPLPVPQSWIRRPYQEESQLKTCVQVRPLPDEERQFRPGALFGISVIVTGVKSSEDFPLQDMISSSAALNIHVNTIERSQYDDDYLPVETHSFMEVPAGNLFSAEYGVETLSRYRGWGPLASRQCEDTPVPRSLCIQNESLKYAAEACGCARENNVITRSLPLIYACSASAGSTQYECTVDYFSQNPSNLFVSLDACPTQCVSYGRDITTQSSVPISDGQLSYIRSYLSSIGANATDIVKDEVIYARIGAGTLLIRHLDEAPSTSFSALMGQIGGNAGLWCGLSFVMMFEVLEFCTVAGFYALRKRRKNKLLRRS